MTTDSKEYDNELDPDGMPRESASAEPTATVSERTRETFETAPLPWIGALPNPRLGPMVVVNERGYLVPVCTASDLLRGFRMFWRVSREQA